MKLTNPLDSLSILLADDDRDDRFFFEKALHELPFATELATVENGEELMTYLRKNAGKLPDVLFLDLNMPRKSGAECLVEIKKNQKIAALPVIIYSTSLSDDVAKVLYDYGAHYYIRKSDFPVLKKLLHRVLTKLVKHNFSRPPASEFIMNEAVK